MAFERLDCGDVQHTKTHDWYTRGNTKHITDITIPQDPHIVVSQNSQTHEQCDQGVSLIPLLDYP